MSELRTCTKCGETKPATAEFFKTDARYELGLTRWCKACAVRQNRDRKRERRATDPAFAVAEAAYNRAAHERQKARVAALETAARAALAHLTGKARTFSEREPLAVISQLRDALGEAA